MIERTPLLIVAALAVLTVSACGDRTAVPGAGRSGPASEEPIDAVPLPLDDNPLTPPPAEAPVAATQAKPAASGEAPTTESAVEETTTPTPVGPPDPSAKPARMVVAPREPGRPVERPVERPADRAAPQPAPQPAPEKQGDKPVLTF